ncbi:MULTISPECIES: hypothetical protein [unclassified Streptomyces]|uniref:Uncharacterized protein n=1 Tax=Streptomyces sp. NBC_00119 TaxID=2975659 RepID=A0AAU1UL36_9ACTN|nr:MULTISPECIES: hypothetical protein [unclassified Streptomyces]MCX4649705.1 hypothetical protein [Streptomyces sp. NBC_01446]MCX5321086.1 hypothetical protein [Streptomyces sp. NBC_00120]
MTWRAGVAASSGTGLHVGEGAAARLGDIQDRGAVRERVVRLRLVQPQITQIWADHGYVGELVGWARRLPPEEHVNDRSLIDAQLESI